MKLVNLIWGALLLLAPAVPGHTSAACEENSGRILRETYFSSILNGRMVYSVYLPPCYEQDTAAYPVLYLLHGSNEDDGHWQRLGLADVLDSGISGGLLPPMVVVLPFGDWIANRNQFDQVSWANVLLEDLLPLVESSYRLDGRRAIGGISRGGFWAYQLAFRHPQMFSAVGGHSAFFDLYHAPDDYNPLALALNAPGLQRLHIWLDRGADDFAAPGLEIMHERLTVRGLPHDYVVHPVGQHNNAYWSQHLEEYMLFYAAGWSAPVVTPTPASPAVVFATATPRPSPTPAAAAGRLLFVPAVSFLSLQTDISLQALEQVRAGASDPQLVLTSDAAASLLAAGVPLHAATRTVSSSQELANLLWRERGLYTLLPFDELTLRYRPLWVDDLPVVDRLDDYPFVFTGGSYNPAHLTRITLSGVTALTRNVIPALDSNGVHWAADGIRPYVVRSDFFHTSNEVSFYPTCPDPAAPTLGGPTSFCSRPEHFELFTYLGLDIVELSGNHNNDYGYQAYLDTLTFYEANGIATVGGGATPEAARRPLLLEHNGSRIAMLSCNAVGPYYALANDDPRLAGGVRPGAAACDWGWLEAALPLLAAENDVVIMTVQHVEYEEYTPTDEQRWDYRRLAELGADLVAGTAPHKPQTFEFYVTRDGRTVLIHYGLGNLFFDQPFWGNMRFFMDTLYIYEGRLLTVELFTGIIDDLARPRLMTAEERLNFLHFMFVQQDGSS